MSPHAGVHTTFLRQCVSAIDSLSLLADAMRAAKPGLLQLLKGAGLSKEVEAYYSRTVDAAADLRDAIYLGAAKQLLPVSYVVGPGVHLPACVRAWRRDMGAETPMGAAAALTARTSHMQDSWNGLCGTGAK